MRRPKIMDRIKASFAPATKAPAPAFAVIPPNEPGAATEILFYGDVVETWPVNWWTGERIEGNFIALDDVLDRLDAVKDAPELVIRLNSSGGDLISGVTICNLLRSFSGKKTCIVEGLAASAASIILCGADTVKMHPGSMVMIHNAACLMYGYYTGADLAEYIDACKATELSAKRIYAERTGKTDEELQSLMDATTWLVGQDAIDEGFADELIERAAEDGDGEDLPPDANEENAPISDPFAAEPFAAKLTGDGRYLVVGGVRHNIAALGGLPPSMTSHDHASYAAAAAMGDITDDDGDAPVITAKELDVDINNEADLRQHYPELVAAIEADAIISERERIRDILEVAPAMSDKELVNHALFETSMSAADLALETTRRQMQAGADFLAALDDDSDDSDADDVETRPTEAAEDQAERDRRDEQATTNMLDRIINQFNGKGVR